MENKNIYTKIEAILLTIGKSYVTLNIIQHEVLIYFIASTTFIIYIGILHVKWIVNIKLLEKLHLQYVLNSNVRSKILMKFIYRQGNVPKNTLIE